MKNVHLGDKLKDTITGFTGIAIGKVSYITGCDQYLIQPKGSKPSEKPEPQWIDEGRLAIVASKRVKVKKTEKPGADMPAPVK